MPRLKFQNLPSPQRAKILAEMRELQRFGWSLRRIASNYNLSHERVRQLINGTTKEGKHA